ncbi:MAG: trimethylamine methyltransferase family protein [Promethearchaeota archaeon]
MVDSIEKNCRPHYRFLSEKQIKKIHLASLEILENIGVRVSLKEGVKLLEKAGCTIEDDDIVHIPNWLVEESIHSAPSRITIYNREGQEAMRLENHNNYFGLGTDLIRTQDLKTGQIRLSVLQDVKNAARIADFCQNIDFIASFALPSDVPTNLMYINCVKAMMENSVKPIFFTAAGREDLAFIIEMAELIAGGAEQLKYKPFIIHYSEPTAPLSHSYGAIRKLFLCAEKGIPICYTPGDIMGATAVVTLAGGIAQANAEALSGIVLHQLKKKGAPIISGFALVPLDMRLSTFLYGAPEFRIANSAFADLFHYYNLPMWSTVGSDSFSLDQQAAFEHGVATLLATLDGANLIHDIGYLGQGLLGNPASIIMCNEIISYIKRFVNGFKLNREKLAIDIIRKVGQGGEFLSEKHTLKHFREELWRPEFFNRDDPETWIKKGKKDYRENLIHITLNILETHQPMPLIENIQQRINEIYINAEKELREKDFKA